MLFIYGNVEVGVVGIVYQYVVVVQVEYGYVEVGVVFVEVEFYVGFLLFVGFGFEGVVVYIGVVVGIE